MTCVALEASGLLTERPTGVGTYGRQLVAALCRRQRHDYALVHSWQRCRRRRHVKDLRVPMRSYLDGRRLHRDFNVLHALDTRLPRAYHGPLVATLFDIASLLPLSASKNLSSAGFREKKMRAYREIAARADRVITLSQAIAQEIHEHLRPRGRVAVVPPGIDPPDETGDPVDPARLGPLGVRAPFVLFVGALCPRKNLHAITQAFERTQERYPELQLVVVGEAAYGWHGSEAEQALHALKDRLGPRHVVTLGYLPRTLLWEVYTAASAFLYVSHYEGFGLPVLEAQSVGTPVVASRRGGIVEASGGLAWLVEPEDVEQIAQQLAEVLAGGSAVDERVQRAKVHARSFSWERACARLEDIYAELVS